MSPPSSNPSHLFGWDFFLNIIISLGDTLGSNLLNS